jgi:hypothetical protein
MFWRLFFPLLVLYALSGSIAAAQTNDCDARQVQSQLNDLGYDAGPADGQIGSKSIAALKSYQAEHNLAATGALDDATRSSVCNTSSNGHAHAHPSHDARDEAAGEAPNGPTDLVDLLGRRKVEVEVVGSDIETVTMRLRRTGTEPLTVSIHPGTFFESSNAGAQNMVGTASDSVNLTGGGWTTLTLAAACASRPRDIPTDSDRFAVKRLPPKSELAVAAGAVWAAHASTAVTQAAIWIVSDNADYDDLGELVESTGPSAFGGTRVINETEAAQAMRILDRAGIDLRQKRIWQDRNAIANGVKDRGLAAWLRAG